MIIWHVGLKEELMDQGINKDGDHVYISDRYLGTDCGYEEQTVKIVKTKDGAIFFSDDNGEGLIYLHPEQVEHLRKILQGK